MNKELLGCIQLEGNKISRAWKSWPNDTLFAGGDLYEELKRNKGTLAEHRVATKIIQPCMQALAYLHEKVGSQVFPAQNWEPDSNLSRPQSLRHNLP